MKTVNHNLNLPFREQGYKHGYIERKIQELEAQEEIKEYERERKQERCINYSRDDLPQRLT